MTRMPIAVLLMRTALPAAAQEKVDKADPRKVREPGSARFADGTPAVIRRAVRRAR
jgi:hypothetical protein